MACVACRDLPLPSAEEPPLATSGRRSRAVPAKLGSQPRPGIRRLRSATASVNAPATTVPALSRITYRAGTISIR